MIHCRVAGYTLGLESSCPRALERLGRLLSPLVTPGTRARPDILYQVDAASGGYRLSWGGRSYEQLHSSDLLATLLTDLSTVLVESTDTALLHAGAVATSDSSLVIAGYSGSGKTTLSAGLTKAGLRFLSDEFTPLSLVGPQVTPLPMPLKFREATLALLPALEPEIEIHEEPFVARGERVFFGVPAASALAAHRSWPVGAVVFPKLRRGEDTALRPIRPALAVGYVLEFVLNWRVLGPSAFHVAADLAARVPCYELIYEQIDEAIEQLLRIAS